jgi:hypothetical protein
MLMGSVFTPAFAQAPAKDDTPTFYHLLPGVYVNGWPRFTITYPKEWVERHAQSQEAFGASAPGADRPSFGVAFGPSPLPLEALAENIAAFRRNSATDVTVVSDKPSQLRDGSPAREVELQFVLNGVPCHNMALATKKGDLWITTVVLSDKGRIGEDLKAILYSIELQPGKDVPVKVPPDVQGFLNRYSGDLVSHDLAKVMSHYSDRYLNSGIRKGGVERFWRQTVGLVKSFEIGVTEFVTESDRAYLTGFVPGLFFGKHPLGDSTIIKENGEWKWYGNQRDAVP